MPSIGRVAQALASFTQQTCLHTYVIRTCIIWKYHGTRRDIGAGGLSAASRNHQHVHQLVVVSMFFRVYLWMVNPKCQIGTVSLPSVTRALHAFLLIRVDVIVGHPRYFGHVLKACESQKHCVNIVLCTERTGSPDDRGRVLCLNIKACKL